MINNGELKLNAKIALKGKIGKFALLILAMAGLLIVINGINTNASNTLSMTYVFAYTIYIIIIGIYNMALTLARTGDCKLEDATHPSKNILKFILLIFLKNFYITLWTILLIVPGIIKTLSYAMAEYILLDNPDMSANQSITESRRLMNGHKFQYFCLSFSFIGWWFLVGITFGLVGFYILPYWNVASANFYLKLKQLDNNPNGQNMNN